MDVLACRAVYEVFQKRGVTRQIFYTNVIDTSRSNRTVMLTISGRGVIDDRRLVIVSMLEKPCK